VSRTEFDRPPGAEPLEGRRTAFRVWSPHRDRVEVVLVGTDRVEPLTKDSDGFHNGEIENVGPGDLYLYRLDGEEDRPDPASRRQPQGVHGPSEVVDLGFDWTDSGWAGPPLDRYIIYELHVGTFTPQGDFDGVIGQLDRLVDLGVTAIEIMPVAQFPGGRNWGYDGVYPYAVQDTYGGPQGLMRLVDACHRMGLAVILDVVYNHLGPEGNYSSRFGPYFTDAYRTPWGDAVNFDDAHSDGVRDYFTHNALQWIERFHIDALRLDAVHAIRDASVDPFLAELARRVQKSAETLGRRVHLMPESSQNDPNLVRSPDVGGLGLDAVWSDDFHHSVHTLLTGESGGYYQDYGRPEDLAAAYSRGFVYTGQYSPFRRRRHGAPPSGLSGRRFVVCVQNHDQIGNRMTGDRKAASLSADQLKLAAGLLLLSPFVPLLFMGEEYADPAPFPYFISHTDEKLVEAVRKGRKREFKSFAWAGTPPDPAAEATFRSAVIDPGLRGQARHRGIYDFHRELIRLRKNCPPLADLDLEGTQVWLAADRRTLTVLRRRQDDRVLAVFHLSEAEGAAEIPMPQGVWIKAVDAQSARFGGAGGGVPDRIESPGQVGLHLAPWWVGLFFQDQ
jgi:maltooligosyltrehalose trehalohydrolase